MDHPSQEGPKCHRSTTYRRRKRNDDFLLRQLAAKRKKDNLTGQLLNADKGEGENIANPSEGGSAVIDFGAGIHGDVAHGDSNRSNTKLEGCQHLKSQFSHHGSSNNQSDNLSSEEDHIVLCDEDAFECRGTDSSKEIDAHSLAHDSRNDIEIEASLQHMKNQIYHSATGPSRSGEGDSSGNASGNHGCSSQMERDSAYADSNQSKVQKCVSGPSRSGKEDCNNREVEDCDLTGQRDRDLNSQSQTVYCAASGEGPRSDDCFGEDSSSDSGDEGEGERSDGDHEDDDDGDDDDDEGDEDDGDDDDGDDDDGGDDSNDSDNGNVEGNNGEAGLVGNFNFEHWRLQLPIRMFRACTVKEALAMVLALLSKHNSTYESIIDTCKVMNVMLGREYLPSSKKLLWKFLNRNNLGLQKLAYCKICHRSLGLFDNLAPLTACCRRQWPKKKIPYFMKMSLKRQFADFLNKPEFRRLLRAKFERQKINEDGIEDIFDSANYRGLEEPNQPLSYEWNFSYTFNTDGFRVARFSGVQGWPIYVSLNENRKGVRQKFIFLAVVWVGKGEPDMNIIMDSFVDQANELSQHGIQWTLDNVVITSKFFPTTCTVDAQARCKILNSNSPAGFEACTFCTHTGLMFEGAVRYPVLPHPEIVHVPERRTDASWKANMVAAAEQGVDQQGVHGPAAVMNLRFFDLGRGFSTDDLHPIYEGAVKAFMELVLDDADSDHYIGTPANIAIINRRLLSIKPPTILSRTPREIDSRGSWRGHEWRNWALYYSVPCMDGILRGIKMTMWKKFVRALFLTARDSIRREDEEEGLRLLDEYATSYQNTFGVEAMTFNVHMLSHVIENIRLLGPPHVHSTFQFETWNLKLRKSVKSLHDPVNQIVNRFLIHRFILSVPFDPDFSQEVRLHIRELLEGIPLKQVYRIGDVLLLGRSNQRRLTPNEEQLFREKHLDIPQDVFEYSRALQGRMYLKSIRCDDTILSDNTHLYLHDDTFCTIQCIVRVGDVRNERCFLFVNVLNVVDNVQSMPHLVRVGPHEVLDLIPFTDVRGFAIKMYVGGQNYFIPVSNSCEVD